MVKKILVIFFIVMLVFSLVASIYKIVERDYYLLIVFVPLIFIFSYNLCRLSKIK